VEVVLEQGMKEKSKEFLAEGVEIYKEV